MIKKKYLKVVCHCTFCKTRDMGNLGEGSPEKEVVCSVWLLILRQPRWKSSSLPCGQKLILFGLVYSNLS